MAIDYVGNIHKSVQNMDIDKMSHFFGVEMDLCCHEDSEIKPCPVIGGCSSCWKKFLSQGVGSYVPRHGERRKNDNATRSVGRNKKENKYF